MLLILLGVWGLLFESSELGCGELDCDGNGIPDFLDNLAPSSCPRSG